tara:strand:+ start:139 stop:351 length:213 start_codon:yes stop_codon:yes gene_type:complete
MKNLESLKKEYFEIKFNKYSKYRDVRSSTIAANFAVDDMVNMFKQNIRNISETYALELFQDEINFIKGHQ